MSTRDAVHRLAEHNGITPEEQIERLVRSERRRVVGAQLASTPLDSEELSMLDAAANDIAEASSRT